MTSTHGPNLYRKTLASAERRLRTGERADGAVSWDQRVDVLLITWAG